MAQAQRTDGNKGAGRGSPKKHAPAKAPRAVVPPARTTAAARAMTPGEIQRRLTALEPAWAPPAPAGREQPVAKLVEALGAADAHQRAEAAQALGRAGATEAIAALRARLQDDDKAVRSAAAIALLRLGDRAMFAETVKELAGPAPRAIASAALALGLSGNRDAVEPLLAAFRTHNTVVGAAAASALGMLGDRRAVPPLLEALKADFVPADACAALGQLGEAAAVPPLARTLRHHDEKTRAAAARALGALAGAIKAAPAGKLAPDKLFAALRKLLEDASARVRLSAALALYELGDRAAAPRVVAILREAKERGAV